MSKMHSDLKNGKRTDMIKAVLQYDLDGKFINEYYSINKADRDTGINNQNIGKVCKGERKSAGGFKWKYKEEII